MLRRIKPQTIFVLCVFIACFIWFAQIHPLVPLDMDDWNYINYSRIAIPIPGDQNPTRVFPEVFQPLCANIATWVIQPLINDWVQAQIITNAIVTACFLCVYAYLIQKALRKFTRCSSFVSIILTTLFLAIHFLPVQGVDSNVYFFWSFDMTAFYFYCLSNVLCACVTLYMIITDSFDTFFTNKTTYFKKGLLVIALYFGILSNLFASIIIASYAGITLLYELLSKTSRKAKTRSSFLKGIIARSIVLIFWFISQLLEMTGRRAAQISVDNSFVHQIMNMLKALVEIRFSNLYVVILALALLAIVILIFTQKKRHFLFPKTMIILCIACAFTCLIYLIVVCTKTGASYLKRPDVFFCVFFYVTFAAMLAFAIFLRECPWALTVTPLFVLIIVSYVLGHSNQLRETNIDNYPSLTSIAITKDIVTNLQQADNALTNDPALRSGGQAELEQNGNIEILVPKSTRKDNWPFSNRGHVLAASAYAHGLTQNLLDVSLIPSEAINEKYELYQ